MPDQPPRPDTPAGPAAALQAPGSSPAGATVANAAAPACSVIIPLYDKGRYIGDTVRSVLAQSEPDLELLVIDDGSHDDGPALVQAIAQTDARVRLVRQPNGGVSSARNHGLRLARGRFVFFLDADDLWHRDQVRSLLHVFGQHPQALLAGSAYRMVPGEQAVAVAAALPPLPEGAVVTEPVDDLAARWLLTGEQGFNSSTAAVRAEAFAHLDEWFPTTFSNGEDLDFWFRLNALGPFALTPAQLAVIRIDADGSLTRRHRQSEQFPPYLARMNERARAGRLRGGLNRSWIRFANHYESSLAISKVLHGHRAAAMQLLRSHWRAAASPMWWAAWAMCLLPLSWVRGLRRAWAARGTTA